MLCYINSGRSKTPTRTSCAADRFIPNRSCTDFESAQHRVGSESSLAQNDPAKGVDGYNKEEYERVMNSNLNGDQPSSKILAFRQKAPSAPEGEQFAAEVTLILSNGSISRVLVA